MKKKGFTLVELLATIVVLSVIALIATPIILNVIEKAKKGALVSSVNGLVESANMYYTNEIIKGEKVEDVIFDFEEGIQTSTNKLSYKGKVYNGKLILTSDSDVITCIDDGKYYAYKEKDSDEVISGIGTCLYDGTTGDFTIESDVDVIKKECDEDKKELQEELDAKSEELDKLKEKLSKVTASASDVLSGKTILTSSGLVTGTIPSLAAKTYTPGTSNQTIAAGQYLSGTQTIKGDADLIASNITLGKNIFDVTGRGGEYKIYRFNDELATVSKNPYDFNGSWVKMATIKYSECSDGACVPEEKYTTFTIDLGFDPSTTLIATVYLYVKDIWPAFRINRGYSSGTTTPIYWYPNKLFATKLFYSNYTDDIIKMYNTTNDSASPNYMTLKVSGSKLSLTINIDRGTKTNGTSSSAIETKGTEFYLSGYIIYN